MMCPTAQSVGMYISVPVACPVIRSLAFASDDTIDTLASYSDDRSSCSFYKDSAIDINANDLITGQATGTEIYIPTDCAVGHIINWIKTEKAADDIVNFNTYMANIVPKLFAAYKEIFVNTYDIKIYKANTFLLVKKMDTTEVVHKF